MDIRFEYTRSPNGKWSTDSFIELNERITKFISNCNIDINDKVNTLYVGIMILCDDHFDRLPAGKLNFSLSKNNMGIDVKIPLELKDWLDVEKYVIVEIIKALEVAIKRKHVKNDEIISVLSHTFLGKELE